MPFEIGWYPSATSLSNQNGTRQEAVTSLTMSGEHGAIVRHKGSFLVNNTVVMMWSVGFMVIC